MLLEEFDDCKVLFEILGKLSDVNGDTFTISEYFHASNAAKECASRLHKPHVNVWLPGDGEWSCVKTTHDKTEDLRQFDDPMWV